MRLHASPETASMPSRIGAPPAAARARSGEIGPVRQHDIGAERPQLGRHIVAPHDVDRAHAARLRQHDQMPPDRRIGDVLDHPVAGLQRDMVLEQQAARSAG